MKKINIDKIKKTTVPKGFKLSGIHCGIKKSKKKDLGLIYSQLPCSACGMFTSNRVQAAPLKVCREHLKNKKSRAIIVNSGNANCFTGKKGINDAIDIINTLAKQLDIANRSILIASTGIIGKPLPLKIIKQAIPRLCQSLNKSEVEDFAESISTTDTFKKSVSLKLRIKNKPVVITGVAKGAGMICPHLQMSSKKQATMLAFILTDVAIKKALLKSALACGVDRSFNRITIDRCMSTNDTVLVLANGAAANIVITKRDKDFELFCAGLSFVCWKLARMIVGDAEGSTKLIDILVKGAKSSKEAQLAASAVANSNLFKAAMFGGNLNWGRIVAAIGAVGIALDQNKLEISFNKQRIFKNGKVYSIKPRNSLKKLKVVSVNINLNRGKFSQCVLTSDLTPAYVKINAGYN
ncbi:MAG: bifunctional glutamate N-acetyltransferase/amino-acid acetyltransferase ArgJ [Candidatus Omnitrophica bacterium]|nr:bifunctional glutamate N-acetyltransferase/amino-acid acetyltransferase ArgJ [Candidatus Omnitrophota bacterium]